MWVFPAWSSDELILAFELYCRTPFGRLHHSNPDIVALADAIGRTPSAVAMKCTNFASLDPAHLARGVRGLGNASRADRDTFDCYAADMVALEQAARASAATLNADADAMIPREERVVTQSPTIEGPTEVMRLASMRRVQAAFRRAVIAAYDEKCAVCTLAVPSLVFAGHIIPWAADESRRADPTNGLAFCVLHERAFDCGYFCIEENMTIRISPRVIEKDPPSLHRVGLMEIEGQELPTPSRFAPDPQALRRHRELVFAA